MYIFCFFSFHKYFTNITNIFQRIFVNTYPPSAHKIQNFMKSKIHSSFRHLQDFACNPYSFYALSDEECSFTASNEVTPQSSWYTSSSLDSESGGKFPSLRIGKTAGWTDWESHSECKLPCLAPAKGLELVKRRCSSGSDSGADSCTGLALSVKLCKPDKTTVFLIWI